MKSNSKKLRKKKFFEPLLLYIAHWCDTFPRSLWHVEELLTVLVEWTMLEVQAPPPSPASDGALTTWGEWVEFFAIF